MLKNKIIKSMLLKYYNKRQQRATKPRWKDIVDIDDIKDFLLYERIYCNAAETNLYACDESDVVKKEFLRTIVLEKRKHFLMLWTETFYNNNNKKEHINVN